MSRHTLAVAILVVGAFIAGHLVSSQRAVQAQERVDVWGRYALVEAQFPVTGEGGQTAQGLFKIDTQTGRVWRYTERIRPGQERARVWIATDE